MTAASNVSVQEQPSARRRHLSNLVDKMSISKDQQKSARSHFKKVKTDGSKLSSGRDTLLISQKSHNIHLDEPKLDSKQKHEYDHN